MVARCTSCKKIVVYPDVSNTTTGVKLYIDLFGEKCRCGNVYIDHEEGRIAYDDSSSVVIWNTIDQDWMAVVS